MLKIACFTTSVLVSFLVSLGSLLAGRDGFIAFEICSEGTLLAGPTIVVQPVDQTDCKGNKVTFSVLATGGAGKFHYLWTRKRPVDTVFSLFGALDSMKLPIYNIGVGSDAPSGTMYQVLVADQNGSILSRNAVLTVNEITGISPVGIATYTVNEGDNLSFRVLSSGNPPTGYQWIKKFANGDWRDLTDNSILTGCRSDQLNLTRISIADSGLYKVRVTFPTVNGNLCTETSSITRTIHVKPVVDTEHPVFLNLQNCNLALCPSDLVLANWSDVTSDIQPVRLKFHRLQKFCTQFDLSTENFSDNVTPSADLVLHWGIFETFTPFDPILDETGMILDDQRGQFSLHSEEIDLESSTSGNQYYWIIFWLEDRAGNITPPSERYIVTVTVPARPDMVLNSN